MPDLNVLSERELEILQLLAKGKTNKDIALALFISVNTVKVHLRNIFAKIEVSSRTEATVYAMRAGLVEGVVENVPNGKTVDLQEGETETDKIDDTVVQDTLKEPLLPSTEPQIYPTQQEKIPSAKWWQQPQIILGLVTIFLLIGAGVSWIVLASNNPSEEIPLETNENQWEERKALSFARAGHATVVLENKIILIGGETDQGIVARTETYEVEINQWTALADKPTAVTDAQAVVLGGKVYVPGGRTDEHQATDKLEIFDPAINVWTVGPSLPVKVSAYGLATFEGKLYLFGGWDGEEYLDLVLTYDPDIAQWDEVAQLSSPRGFMSAVVAMDRIFILGGYDGKNALDSTLVFFPGRLTNPWETAAPMPDARYAMGAAFIADRIYVIGGIQRESIPAPQLIFLPANDGWIVRTDSEQGDNPIWSHLGIAVVASKVYALGGWLDGIPTSQNITFQAIYTLPLPIIIK